MELGLLVLLCGLVGLAVGSFLNVVVYRVPRKLSIVRPGSSCPHCGSPIRGRDNVPVVSWLLLRGRCRDCHGPISPRYPLVEASTGLLFVGAALRYGRYAALPALLALLAGLLALAIIDVETLLLPRRIVYPLLAIVAVLLTAAAIWTGDFHPLWVGAACAAVWYGVFFAINRVDARYLGFGDVRLALVLGLGLGWLGVPSALLGFFAANVLGAAVGLALLATKRIQRDRPLPYGVFLAAGAAIAVFVGPFQVHLRGIS